MLTAISRAARRNLIGLILLGLACRVLVPVGYMPAPLSDGGPFVLCPSGMPSALFSIVAARHLEHRNDRYDGSGDGHDASAGGHNAWESCAFGAIPGVFVSVSEYLVPLSPFGDVPPQSNPESVVRILLTAPYQARDPPLAQTIDV